MDINDKLFLFLVKTLPKVRPTQNTAVRNEAKDFQ